MQPQYQHHKAYQNNITQGQLLFSFLSINPSKLLIHLLRNICWLPVPRGNGENETSQTRKVFQRKLDLESTERLFQAACVSFETSPELEWEPSCGEYCVWEGPGVAVYGLRIDLLEGREMHWYTNERAISCEWDGFGQDVIVSGLQCYERSIEMFSTVHSICCQYPPVLKSTMATITLSSNVLSYGRGSDILWPCCQ